MYSPSAEMTNPNKKRDEYKKALERRLQTSDQSSAKTLDEQRKKRLKMRGYNGGMV